MKNVLVLCTGNSCRSQIAHGYLEQLADDSVNIYSAGIETHGVNPNAIATMRKDGLEIAHHTSNHVSEYENINMDYVITVCDHAKEVCPVFPGGTYTFHHNFSDPAKATGSPEDIEKAFDTVRDEIKHWMTAFVDAYLVPKFPISG